MLRDRFDARPVRISDQRSNALATPNYGYEKRQRELAKKRKNEEKKQKKQQGPGSSGQAEGAPDQGASEPASPEAPPPAGS